MREHASLRRFAIPGFLPLLSDGRVPSRPAGADSFSDLATKLKLPDTKIAIAQSMMTAPALHSFTEASFGALKQTLPARAMAQAPNPFDAPDNLISHTQPMGGRQNRARQDHHH